MRATEEGDEEALLAAGAFGGISGQLFDLDGWRDQPLAPCRPSGAVTNVQLEGAEGGKNRQALARRRHNSLLALRADPR